MSGYGPPPNARDAHHAERLYWQRNPPVRPAGYIKTDEAAKALHVTVWVVRKLARAGKLGKVKRVDGTIFLLASDVEAYGLGQMVKGKR